LNKRILLLILVFLAILGAYIVYDKPYLSPEDVYLDEISIHLDKMEEVTQNIQEITFTSPDAPGQLNENKKVVNETLKDLKDMEVPPEYRKFHSRLISSVEGISSELDYLIDFVKTGDPQSLESGHYYGRRGYEDIREAKRELSIKMRISMI